MYELKRCSSGNWRWISEWQSKVDLSRELRPGGTCRAFEIEALEQNETEVCRRFDKYTRRFEGAARRPYPGGYLSKN
jgi:hypothetical protein